MIARAGSAKLPRTEVLTLPGFLGRLSPTRELFPRRHYGRSALIPPLLERYAT